MRLTLFRLAAYGLVAAVFTILSSGCVNPRTRLLRFEFEQPHMGTLFRITLYAPTEAAARDASAAAFSRIAELDRMMTDYDPDSELMRLCREPVGKPVPVSKDLFEVLVKAERVSELSGGAFDVTIGPLVRQWRRARRTGTLPDETALARARLAVGWQKVRLDHRNQTVTLTVPNMQLDLGGIAKGYAADAALRVLQDRGLPRALVAASGDLAIGEAPPGKRGWRIEIGVVRSQAQQADRGLVLSHAAVSTSGDTEQFVVIGGTRYSHIVDPRTGVGLTNAVQVTVVGARAANTDACATALNVASSERTARLLRSRFGLTQILLSGADATAAQFDQSVSPIPRGDDCVVGAVPDLRRK